MLSPQYIEYLDSPENPLAKLFDRLEVAVIQDITRRIATSEGKVMTPTAEWQMIRLMALGELPENILDEIQRSLNLAQEELNALIDDAIETSDRYDQQIAKKMGKKIAPIAENPAVKGTVEAVRRQTGGTFRNMTQSLGFAVRENGRLVFKPLAKYYQDTLDFAAAGVMSGTFDYATAIRRASGEMAASGLRWVDYASGHRDRIGVAARRAVLTGVSQISNEISTARMDDFETDLVQVSAHAGARNKGSGPQNHASWQGKIYRWRRPGHPQTSGGDYPDFIRTTGYGSGEGLGGWNCRHRFDPYIEGESVRVWTEQTLAKATPDPFVFDGKEYEYYDATQQQRKLERNIRYSKEQLLALQEGIDRAESSETRERLQEAYDMRAVRLKEQRALYARFCRAGNLKEQNDRIGFEGFGRSEAARASAAARRKTA